jgi:hypothetical protein
MATFSATVDKWVSDSEEKMEAVFKTAVQFTIDDALDRTPVDTGFLKSSMTVSLSGFTPLREKGFNLNNSSYEMIIAGADLGDTIYANYVANYAQHVEHGAKGRAGRHMVKLAAQNWQTNVNRAVSLAT